MSPEQQPQPEQYLGHSFDDWHHYLITDDDGIGRGDDATPCSRYGRDTETVAWWAIAGMWSFVTEAGEVEDLYGLLDELMGYAVNDNESVLTLVLDHWNELPEAIRANLDQGELE